MKRIFFFSFVVLIMASGCRFAFGKRVRGNGNVTSDTRAISGFDRIEVGGAMHVYLTQDSNYSIRVETDENLLSYVVTDVDGQTLYIHQRDNVNLSSSGRIKVYVNLPRLKGAEVSGASEILGQSVFQSNERVYFHCSGASKMILDIDAPEVETDLSGASTMRLKGNTRQLTVGASGASNFESFDLKSESASVDLSGASEAEVFASVTLTGEASGASHVYYKGGAAANVDQSGASSVKKRD